MRVNPFSDPNGVQLAEKHHLLSSIGKPAGTWKKKEKAYLVHRLDQDTSGVMMFVKNKKLYEELTHNWNDYVLERSYQAIVEGTIKKDGRIENYLSENKMQKVYVSNKKGKKAITNYHVLKNVKGYTLLDVFIETGRKNQIRVHMSSLGHPIAGDRKYGHCGGTR